MLQTISEKNCFQVKQWLAATPEKFILWVKVAVSSQSNRICAATNTCWICEQVQWLLWKPWKTSEKEEISFFSLCVQQGGGCCSRHILLSWTSSAAASAQSRTAAKGREWCTVNSSLCLVDTRLHAGPPGPLRCAKWPLSVNWFGRDALCLPLPGVILSPHV